MPSKSRGGHKHSARSKKRRVGPALLPGSGRQQVSGQNGEPVSQTPPILAKALTPRPILSSKVQHPYVTTELLRIAILAGVMVAILVLLYLFIP